MAENDEGAHRQPNATVVKFEGASDERTALDMPVYGTAMGASRVVDGGAVEQTTLNTGEIIEYRPRPPVSNGIERCYGLYVQGESMYPAHRDGAFLFVQHDSPLRALDDVIVYLRPKNESDDGKRARMVMVKRLIRRTAEYIELEQFTPHMRFQIPMEEVLRIDRVLTNEDFV